MVLPMDAPLGPWFRRHPRLAIAAAVGLFAVITVARFLGGDERDATLLLLVLPVALLALAFGLRAGTIAAVGSVALVAAWVIVEDVHLSALGWLSRATPLFLLGVLIGHASDAQRRAEATAARLVVIEERQREAAEINDTIVQRLAAAKWCFENGNSDAGLEELDAVMDAGQDLVVDLLIGLGGNGAERRRVTRSPRAEV